MNPTSLWLELRDFLSYMDASLRAGGLSYGGLAEPVLEAAFLYLGMWLASYLTAFRVISHQLLLTAVLVTLVNHVPVIGWLLSPITLFFLLRQFSGSEGLFMMVVLSWGMSLGFASLIGNPIYS